MSDRPTLATLDKLLHDKHGLHLADVMDDMSLGAQETLFWSGSWLEGFANSRSDLDLYVIGSVDGRPGMFELTAPGLPEMLMSLTPGRVRIDLTVVPFGLVSGVAERLRAFDGDIGYPTRWSPNLREFVHRLKIGIPVIHEEAFDELRSQIDFDRFASYLCRYYHNRADSLLEDVLGLLHDGDDVSAMLVARQRLEAVVDMYLVTLGETNTRVDKWRWKKLNRVLGSDDPLVRSFLVAECLEVAASSSELRRRCHEVLELADSLLLKVI